MSLTADSIFTLLATTTFGVFAVSLDQTIVFWNREAERILGYSSGDVLGKPCSDLLAISADESQQEDCRVACPSIEALRTGRLPSQTQLHMVSSTGEVKLVSLTPVVVGGNDGKAELVVQFLTEAGASVEIDKTDAEDIQSAAVERDAAEAITSPRLTRRELEVLRLVSVGWDTPRIAEELNISPHTVLNHIRHFRRKLDAPTKLDAVVKGIRLGILPVE